MSLDVPAQHNDDLTRRIKLHFACVSDLPFADCEYHVHGTRSVDSAKGYNRLHGTRNQQRGITAYMVLLKELLNFYFV